MLKVAAARTGLGMHHDLPLQSHVNLSGRPVRTSLDRIKPAEPSVVVCLIAAITGKPWVRRVVTWQLDGSLPKDLRLTWGIDSGARAALEQDLFGKHVLITDHDDWPAGEVIAGYRSQSEAEFSFRQLKDPRVVSISPMFHWTGHNIRVHIFTCVLALQIAHLMRLKAAPAGLHLSVRELLAGLAGIGETVLLYPGDRGRPRAHRMLTDTSPVQDQLSDILPSVATRPNADMGNTPHQPVAPADQP